MTKSRQTNADTMNRGGRSWSAAGRNSLTETMAKTHSLSRGAAGAPLGFQRRLAAEPVLLPGICTLQLAQERLQCGMQATTRSVRGNPRQRKPSWSPRTLTWRRKKRSTQSDWALPDAEPRMHAAYSVPCAILRTLCSRAVCRGSALLVSTGARSPALFSS